MRRLLNFLAQQSRSLHLGLGIALSAAMGLLHYLTGPYLVFSIFYLLPVCLVSFFVGRGSGVLVSVVSGVASLVAELATEPGFLHPLIPYWNAAARLGVFVAFTIVLSELRDVLHREKELARTDALTGAANPRLFAETLNNEIRRSRRSHSPLTLAYLDIDNFKAVNDESGHAAGDALLRQAVEAIRQSLRATDVVARLGGDEFVILLPDTGQRQAETALQKLRRSLVQAGATGRWPVTFSIGVVTWAGGTERAEELVKIADELMYAAKKAGKDRIAFGVPREPGSAP